ncbi:hypothetical protein [Specibacter sp. RAF43]|uniref:hypothetical protein n=1 Tax=Specibacter sp. RAF43 TaxID=3233057 RepID=UPI003F968D33
MTTMQWIWIIIGIVVLLIVVGFLVTLGRRQSRARMEQRNQEDREHAARLRDEARDAGLDARENQAAADRKRAAAEQAAVDAERLKIESERERAAAADRAAEAADRLRQAEAVDPGPRESADLSGAESLDTAAGTAPAGRDEGRPPAEQSPAEPRTAPDRETGSA